MKYKAKDHPIYKDGFEVEKPKMPPTANIYRDKNGISINGRYDPTNIPECWEEVIEERDLITVIPYGLHNTRMDAAMTKSERGFAVVYQGPQFTESEIRERLSGPTCDPLALLEFTLNNYDVSDCKFMTYNPVKTHTPAQVLSAFTKTPQPERFTAAEMEEIVVFSNGEGHSWDGEIWRTRYGLILGFDNIMNQWKESRKGRPFVDGDGKSYSMDEAEEKWKGDMDFTQSPPAERYTAEEVCEILEEYSVHTHNDAKQLLSKWKEDRNENA